MSPFTGAWPSRVPSSIETLVANFIRHKQSAHGGIVARDCGACQELRAKIVAAENREAQAT